MEIDWKVRSKKVPKLRPSAGDVVCSSPSTDLVFSAFFPFFYSALWDSAKVKRKWSRRKWHLIDSRHLMATGGPHVTCTLLNRSRCSRTSMCQSTNPMRLWDRQPSFTLRRFIGSFFIRTVRTFQFYFNPHAAAANFKFNVDTLVQFPLNLVSCLVYYSVN